jgi:hypothetical protein
MKSATVESNQSSGLNLSSANFAAVSTGARTNSRTEMDDFLYRRAVRRPTLTV